MSMKWFRIATAGQTTDGREIQPEWIEQMAATYDPAIYGARINVEHVRGWYPDSEFGAYGDVLALKSDAVMVDGEERLALFAQIKPNDKLKALNAKNQKIYTSVEIDTNFAKTGKAYLVGLAVTDSPASLGTEMLTFCANAKQNPLADRKQSEGNLFTAAVLTDFDFSEPKSLADSIVERIAQFFTDKDAKDSSDEQDDLEGQEETEDEVEIVDLTKCFDELCQQFKEQLDAKSDEIRELKQQVQTLSTQIDSIAAIPDRPLAVSHTHIHHAIDC
ncbi:GPO family capsid scaffolding protein [Moraxella nasibovis]|uniref:GPO family capsid scaffolding protein n=1 Tax=Moraxella nasibovis TaxID=2904120 RepID=UPI00240F6EBC|nr:GPO family capsid scaffolding protein [Moraxella nasibovis]WFF38048.1 GPO family capsid scaffolding protein [Moraxella nasibovis]